jgi:hypothetical protein
MKRIQVKSITTSSEGSELLHVQRDREKKNTTSLLTSYPNLWKIVLFGSLVAIVCLGLLYIVDPALASELSVSALSIASFNQTMIRTRARSSIQHYTNYFMEGAWQQQNGSINTIPQPTSEYHMPPIKEGYRVGLVTHSTGKFEFIWQPPLAEPAVPGGGGIVFIAPACKRPATEWFPRSEECPSCQPMPLQLSVVDQFRRRGFAVLVMSPVENKERSQCWHQNDRQPVGLAVQYVREATADIFPGAVSLYAIGVENGGVFLGNFAESLGITYQARFAAICLMNSGLWHMNMKAATFPALVFLDLARNGELCEHNSVTVTKLHDKGIDAAQFHSDPQPVTRDYFLPILSAAQSEAYQKELISAGFLWPASYVLLKDPVTERYRFEMIEVRRAFICMGKSLTHLRELF